MIQFIPLLLKYRKHLLAVVAFFAITGGAYFAVLRLADERCAGQEDSARVTALENENAALRASMAKITTIRNEVRNATDGITPGVLPPYTATALDCLRDDKKCVRPSASTGR